jgi:hypothetical protein
MSGLSLTQPTYSTFPVAGHLVAVVVLRVTRAKTICSHWNTTAPEARCMSFTRFQHCHTLHFILFSRAGLMTFRSLLRENQTSFYPQVISPISTPQPRMTIFQLVLYVAIPHHQRTVVDQAVSTTSPSAQQVQLSGSEHYV